MGMAETNHKMDLVFANQVARIWQILFANKFVVAVGVIAFISILGLSYSNFRGSSKKVKDFIAFEGLKKDVDHSSLKQIDRLNRYTHRYPELKPQVEYLLARALMNQKDLSLAMALTQHNLTYGSFVRSYYLDFSKISFLIEERQLEEALALSLDLEKATLKDPRFWEEKKANAIFGADLVLFNKLRIATLFKMLGNLSEEISALSELKQMITEGIVGGTIAIPKENSNRFEAQFLKGMSTSLLDFIAAREKTLKP